MNRRNFLKGLIATGAVAIAQPQLILVEDVANCPVTIRPNFDEIVSTTLKHYAPILRDNLMSGSLVWEALKKEGSLK